jgi:hypothetical protein
MPFLRSLLASLTDWARKHLCVTLAVPALRYLATLVATGLFIADAPPWLWAPPLLLHLPQSRGPLERHIRGMARKRQGNPWHAGRLYSLLTLKSIVTGIALIVAGAAPGLVIAVAALVGIFCVLWLAPMLQTELAERIPTPPAGPPPVFESSIVPHSHTPAVTANVPPGPTILSSTSATGAAPGSLCHDARP